MPEKVILAYPCGQSHISPPPTTAYLSARTKLQNMTAATPRRSRAEWVGLVEVVRREFSLEVMSGDVFIFINRRRDRIKLLM